MPKIRRAGKLCGLNAAPTHQHEQGTCEQGQSLVSGKNGAVPGFLYPGVTVPGWTLFPGLWGHASTSLSLVPKVVHCLCKKFPIQPPGFDSALEHGQVLTVASPLRSCPLLNFSISLRSSRKSHPSSPNSPEGSAPCQPPDFSSHSLGCLHIDALVLSCLVRVSGVSVSCVSALQPCRVPQTQPEPINTCCMRPQRTGRRSWQNSVL